ncbi:MAG TPA: DRTGG domain-containing protein, partial [bacterium]|nr:DRTGG domain-containing protein [bacterium]
GLNFASSIHLDALSLARHLEAKLILVVGGDEDEILDDITFVKKHLACDEVQIAGVIINRVKDVDDFTATYMAEIEALGVKVLGVLPYKQELTYMPVRYLVDHLFAKVIGGEGGLHKIVQSVFVGAMSVSAAVQNPLFKKENKMIITSGDRSDMILVALETDTSCVVLTNNTLPPANIVAKADAANVPMLLVPWDTYRTAQQIDLMDPLLTKDDKPKLELLKKLVGESVKTQALFD